MTVKLTIQQVNDLIKAHGLEEYGRTQKVIDAEVIRFCEPYVPFDKGVLTASASTATKVGSGEVRYQTPYARYQYYGEVYGPNIPMTIGGEQTFRSKPGQKKSPTGRELQYNKEVHPLAGSFWFERMKADHKKDILEEARQVSGAK